MFVLEVRNSTGQGSINNGGHFQSDIRAIEAEVKDEARFPQKWSLFRLWPEGYSYSESGDFHLQSVPQHECGGGKYVCSVLSDSSRSCEKQGHAESGGALAHEC